jgi:hypothetical protein
LFYFLNLSFARRKVRKKRRGEGREGERGEGKGREERRETEGN